MIFLRARSTPTISCLTRRPLVRHQLSVEEQRAQVAGAADDLDRRLPLRVRHAGLARGLDDLDALGLLQAAAEIERARVGVVVDRRLEVARPRRPLGLLRRQQPKRDQPMGVAGLRARNLRDLLLDRCERPPRRVEALDGDRELLRHGDSPRVEVRRMLSVLARIFCR
jgi:hypothetical protein